MFTMIITLPLTIIMMSGVQAGELHVYNDYVQVLSMSAMLITNY